MVEMNPYYAHESSVGPVFDITRWTGRGVANVAVVGLLFGVTLLVAAALVYEPTWLFKKPPEGFEDLVAGIRKGHKHYAWAMRGGIALSGLLGGVCVLGSVAMITDLFRRDYYLPHGRRRTLSATALGNVLAALGTDFAPLGTGIAVGRDRGDHRHPGAAAWRDVA